MEEECSEAELGVVRKEDILCRSRSQACIPVYPNVEEYIIQRIKDCKSSNRQLGSYLNFMEPCHEKHFTISGQNGREDNGLCNIR